MIHKPDKYPNFPALKKNERPEAYRIVPVDRDSTVVVAAPHGGKIEPGTSELARQVAGEDLSLYLFEGCKANHNRDLHITSANFDEPEGRELMRRADRIVTLHGEGSDELVVRIGGLDTARIKHCAQRWMRRGS
jgi:phage replication-related protein YjqB (UPF0714/DUF867 family)